MITVTIIDAKQRLNAVLLLSQSNQEHYRDETNRANLLEGDFKLGCLSY